MRCSNNACPQCGLLPIACRCSKPKPLATNEPPEPSGVEEGLNEAASRSGDVVEQLDILRQVLVEMPYADKKRFGASLAVGYIDDALAYIASLKSENAQLRGEVERMTGALTAIRVRETRKDSWGTALTGSGRIADAAIRHNAKSTGEEPSSGSPNKPDKAGLNDE